MIVNTADIRNLIDKLNYYNQRYFNDGVSEITDAEYDAFYFMLEEMEKTTGIVYQDSPTQTVNYIIQTKLPKVKHDHPMLSLSKTKKWEDLVKFVKEGKKHNSRTFVSAKLDGLTAYIIYDSEGNLKSAETRGDGAVGEDITENIKCIKNLPIKVPSHGKEIHLEGEVIVKYKDFHESNSKLRAEEKFAHPRNYASGAIRQLDSKVTKERNLSFVAWKNLDEENSYADGLYKLKTYGFEVVPYLDCKDLVNEETFKVIDSEMEDMIIEGDYPIDGLVFTYDNIGYGNSLGSTSHHRNNAISFKYAEEIAETTLRDIIWQVGKESITPVAVFDEVELNGTKITKASVHNWSIIKSLKLGIGDKIGISKMNEIIPQIVRNYTGSGTCELLKVCPECGKPVRIQKLNDSEILVCTNPNCKGKNLAKFKQFVSKPAMNIEGLSESTLTRFYERGFIRKFKDIYCLIVFEKTIKEMNGFGKKSFDKLIESIEKSRKVTLKNYLVALSIPNIGKSASETISNHFEGSYNSFYNALKNRFDFTQLPDFGETMNKSLYDWFDNRNPDSLDWDIEECLSFIETAPKVVNDSSFVSGKTFVITGKLSQSRSVYENYIKTNGGKLAGSVSKKTDYLVTNEQSGSTKYNKAVELNIPIITEEEFKKLCQI